MLKRDICGIMAKLLLLVNALGFTGLLRLSWGRLVIRRGTVRNLRIRGKKFSYRTRTSDEAVIYSAFAHGSLPIKLRKNFAWMRPSLVIDAGANIGAVSVLLHSIWPDARFVAIEPDPGNLKLLKGNLASAAINSTVIGAGLWHRTCKLGFRDHGVEPWSFEVREKKGEDEVGFDSVTLEQMTEGCSPRSVVVKMDIEGAEREVFANISKEVMDRLLCLIVELHDRKAPGCGQAVIRALSKTDLSITVSDEYLIAYSSH